MLRHHLLPFAVCVLNVALGLSALLRGFALLRGTTRPVNWLFAAVAASLALWSFGLYQLRRAPDEGSALAAEHLLHVGILTMPAFYYHLVRVVTRAARPRTGLVMAYGASALLVLAALAAPHLLVKGVVSTPRGWTPVSGPFASLAYLVFLLVLAGTLRPLRASRRTPLIAATLVMLVTPVVNVAGFVLVRQGLTAVELPPLLPPASFLFVILVWFATLAPESEQRAD